MHCSAGGFFNPVNDGTQGKEMLTMLSPFKGRFRVTSPRGKRILLGKSEFHKGIDLVGLDCDTVYSVAKGTVYTLYEKNGFGKYIRQLLPDGRRIYYAHLDEIYVQSKSQVDNGTPLGKMGATGKVTGPHLHLELRPVGTSAESLDITEFCGLENEIGTYTDKQKHSTDSVVDALMQFGIVTEENRASWELMLTGKAPVRYEYARVLLSRCCDKIRMLERKNT